MSAAPAGLAAAVSKSGKCNREVRVGERKHVIQHSWRLHLDKVQLTTVLLDSKSGKGGKNKHTAYVENSEKALSSKGAEMAEEVLKKTRDWWNKAQQRQGGSSRSTRRNADGDITCPIITALRGSGGQRTRSGATTNPPVEQEEVSTHLQVRYCWCCLR